ncbi:MAG: hypothetical protein ACE366_03180 [Bradymonadia bacterium]
MGYLLLGVGVAGTMTGLISQQKQEWHHRQADIATHRELYWHHAAHESNHRHWAHGGYIVGGVALTTALLLLVWSGEDSEQQHLSVTQGVEPTHLMASVKF